MTPIEEFERFAASLIGLPITHLWRGYGSALFVELGTTMPRKRRDGSLGNPEGEVTLGIEWSWRIEDRFSILCGSWSEEDSWEPVFDKLRNERVARCELFSRLPEVILTTVSGTRLLTFSTTDGQPQWHLIDRRDGPPRCFDVREGSLHFGDGTEPSI